MKLTPWFPGHIKPVHPGVYQQKSGVSDRIGYQRWDGRFWHKWHPTAEAAAQSYAPVTKIHQDDPWRGLAHKPRS